MEPALRAAVVGMGGIDCSMVPLWYYIPVVLIPWGVYFWWHGTTQWYCWCK